METAGTDVTRKRVGRVLGPLLFVAAGLAGEAGGLPRQAAWTAALVVLMATWWITEALPLAATACLPLVVYPVLGVTSLPAVAMQYLDPVNWLFLGGMLIAASMQQWGLHRRFALAIIDTIGTNPRRIVLGFMLGTGFISLWISNTATAMMMYPIGLAVILKLEEQAGRGDPLVRRLGLALMLGIAYGASIGGIGTKIGTAPNLIMVRQGAEVLGREIDFLTWVEIALPIVLVALPVVWLYLVRVAAPLPATGFAGAAGVIAAERAGLGRPNRGEWVAGSAFLLAAGAWIFRKDIDLGGAVIPGWWDHVPFGWEDVLGRPVATLWPPIARLLSGDTGDAVVAIVVGGALLLVPVQARPLRFALDAGRALRVPWHLLVLLGGSLAMAWGIQATGLSDRIADALQALPHVGPFVALLLVCLITVALTEVASNVATTSILLPLVAAAAPGFGLHPAPLMFAVTFAASFGFMLPAGTPPNAIVFASGYISVPQMARSGLAVDLFGVVLIATLCGWLVPRVLGL